MSKTIDLAAFLTGQRLIETLIDDLNSQLALANIELREFNAKTKEQIIAELNAGATTGDPLQDEIIRHFGLDGKAIDKITAFSRRLVAAAGRELLIAIPYRKQKKFPMFGPVGPDCFTACCGYVLGILSGESLRLKTSPESSLEFPFKCYIVSGFEDQRDSHGGPTALTISSQRFRLNPLTILESIVGYEQHLEVEGRYGLSFGNSVTIVLRENERVCGESLPDGWSFEIENLEKRLMMPTPEEVIQAEGI